MSIYHLEPFDRFTQRVVSLNALYSPEDPLHAALTGGDSHPDAAAARKKLATLHKEFPTGAAIHEQAAFLLRGFTGLAVFSEANFRTGWDYTSEVIEHAGKNVTVDLERARSFGASLWEQMQSAFGGEMPRAKALDRDDFFQETADWIKGHIQ